MLSDKIKWRNFKKSHIMFKSIQEKRVNEQEPYYENLQKTFDANFKDFDFEKMLIYDAQAQIFIHTIDDYLLT